MALSLSTVAPEESLHLFEYDRQAPLDIQEDLRWHEEHATWIDFTYASPNGGRVPARLVIPDGKGPFPGMILQHGGPGTLEDMVDFARTFARYGAVTIMITSPYRRPGGWVITEYMGNTWPIFTERDLEIRIQLINDLQRAIDILLERPDVDPEKLAYFGVSWGGAIGGLLAGVEDRLAAYVLVVGDGGLVEHTADPGEDGLNVHFSEGWAALMWPTEPLHFVGRAAPAALLFQNGIHDTYVKPHDAIRFQTAASEPKTVLWYDAGHNLPWNFVRDAAEWLQPFLGDRLLLLAPDYHPNAVIVDRAVLVLMVFSAGAFLWDAFRRRDRGWGGRAVWLPAMILLGPLGLVLYWIAPRTSVTEGDAPVLPRWRHVLGITTLSMVALVAGIYLGDQTTDTIPIVDFRLRLLMLYITMWVMSWLLSLLARRIYRASLLAHILMLNLVWAIFMVFPSLLGGFFSAVSWLFYPVLTCIGIVLAYPLHFWMVNLGLERWLPVQQREVLSRRLGWPAVTGLLVFSYLAVLGSVIVMMHLSIGLPWRDVILILRGVYS